MTDDTPPSPTRALLSWMAALVALSGSLPYMLGYYLVGAALVMVAVMITLAAGSGPSKGAARIANIVVLSVALFENALGLAILILWAV